jgi:hypothetical protein
MPIGGRQRGLVPELEAGFNDAMFEHRSEKLAPMPVFVRRLVGSVALAGAGAGIALGIGVLGYHFIAELAWVDAVLDASMILGGMGPVNELHTTSAKLFASAYALFSGLVFIGVMGLVLAPLLHRTLHRFHLAEEDLEEKRSRRESH